MSGGRTLKYPDMEVALMIALTDDEILAIYRQRIPYVNLSTAKALYRLERRYQHLKCVMPKDFQP
jgi:hypothetical protein